MNGTDYRNLVAWQKAMNLVRQTYAVSASWPAAEMYGLTSQIRRAAVSVPSNIAEGHGRVSAREFCRHLSIAYGSLMELETQLLIARDLGYCSKELSEAVYELAQEEGRIINGLMHSLKA